MLLEETYRSMTTIKSCYNFLLSLQYAVINYKQSVAKTAYLIHVFLYQWKNSREKSLKSRVFLAEKKYLNRKININTTQ